MTCPSCQEAEKNPLSGLYQANCTSCNARAIAHGQELWEASREKRITGRYKALLVGIWGPDHWQEGHEQVKRWANTMKEKA